ncbi:hypothetical protein NC651_017541 [Populus alba x Populus x berolinensis]|nr:hypothetical protein NC651_017541 [Populus alba x Populus x berolinensis]
MLEEDPSTHLTIFEIKSRGEAVGSNESHKHPQLKNSKNPKKHRRAHSRSSLSSPATQWRKTWPAYYRRRRATGSLPQPCNYPTAPSSQSPPNGGTYSTSTSSSPPLHTSSTHRRPAPFVSYVSGPAYVHTVISMWFGSMRRNLHFSIWSRLKRDARYMAGGTTPPPAYTLRNRGMVFESLEKGSTLYIDLGQKV